MAPYRWSRASRTSEVLTALKSCQPGGWLIVTLSHENATTCGATESLAQLAAASAETLVVLDPAITIQDIDALTLAVSEGLVRPGLLTLVVPPGAPPSVTGINHGPVRFFIGPAALLRSAAVAPADLKLETLCYWALWSVIHGANVGVIAANVRQRQWI